MRTKEVVEDDMEIAIRDALNIAGHWARLHPVGGVQTRLNDNEYHITVFCTRMGVSRPHPRPVVLQFQREVE